MTEMRMKVKSVVDEMHRDIINFTQELCRIPSITGEPEEKDAVDLCVNKMKEHGLDVEYVNSSSNRPNAVGKTSQGFDSSLGFSGHVDVVPVDPVEEWDFPPFSATIDQGKLYARGSADCKGGLVCAIFVPEVLRRAGVALKGDLQIAVVVDDEWGAKEGMGVLIETKKFNPDAVIQGDPAGGLDTYTLAHKGNYTLRLKIHGKLFHAAFPDKGVNAVMKMVFVLKFLEEHWLKHIPRRPHILFPEGHQLALGTTISGGIAIPVIPGYCEATLRLNVLPGYRLEELRQSLDVVIAEMKSLDPQLDIEVEELNWNQGDDTPGDEKVVRVLASVIEEVTGFSPRPWGFPSGSMTAYTRTVGGIPNVVWGCGTSEDNGTHSLNEWIDISDLRLVTQGYALAAMDYLGYEEVK